ncbi:MAG: ATP-grasp domain-containing protein [Chloroflexota bacterium]|nr:ATP-grasp domain-containing protein [Chloroflexota bacterium]
MPDQQPTTILCLASNFKGEEFLRECKRKGCRVFLLVREVEANKNWPRESIDEMFYMPSLQLNRQDVIHAVSYLARHNVIHRIVALDDLDVEMVAALREHLRIPGMGETTARYFRDKLAMRVKAHEAGIRVPDFVHVLNYDTLREWMARVPPPWVLKPRSEASSVGIKKIHDPEELWRTLDTLGDRQSYYVLEQYVSGTVYHIDSIVSEREIRFAEAHQYAAPPLDVMHGGGIFSTRTVARGSEEEQRLRALNEHLLTELGLVRGVTHTEFIKGHADGEFYFLETAARVGGAFIAETIEAATGINLWREWARIEVANARDEAYHLGERRYDYAGVVMSLARQEYPDTSAYNDPEIVYRVNKRHHVGLIVASHDLERVKALLDQYMRRFSQDFLASAPAPDTLIE